jgi:DNA-binding protein H-NS
MRYELEQAGINAEDIQIRIGRRRKRAALTPKYRSPDGEEWSGRGHAPLWMRQLELQGHEREEFRIEE